MKLFWLSTPPNHQKMLVPCRPLDTCPFIYKASKEIWLLLLGALQTTAGEFSFLLRTPLPGSSVGKMPSAGADSKSRKTDEMTSRQPCHFRDFKLLAALALPLALT